MDIGKAIELLKEGKPMTRKDWGGNCYIYLQVPADIPKEGIPKMQSIPDDVKDSLLTGPRGISFKHGINVVFSDKTTMSWGITTSDVLSTDWEVYAKNI